MHLTKEQWAAQTYHDTIPRSVKLKRLLWPIVRGLGASWMPYFVGGNSAKFIKKLGDVKCLIVFFGTITLMEIAKGGF